ncbi:MAG TPA: hypothetical protein PKD24_12570 [Pyrinomonadaceae bacterium]|nr:hypothetical protein [Pyrinomonadaceae bacterium]HMP66493.1 hypothetical protein [Pyrinomonadaceae bacterium]
MKTPFLYRPTNYLDRLPELFGAIAIAAGIAVLLVWIYDQWLLMVPVVGSRAMEPSAAVAFVLLGVNFVLVRGERSAWGRTAFVVVSCVNVAVALAILLRYTTGFGIELNAALFPEKVIREFGPADVYTSPQTALLFFLVGASLLLLRFRIKPIAWTSQLLGSAALIVSLALAISDLFKLTITDLGQNNTRTPFASAALFAILSFGALLAHRENGMLSIFWSESAGGELTRRILPFVVLFPILVGWLRLVGEWRGFYSSEFGVVIFTAATIFGFSFTVWLTARSLDRSDLERRQA